MTKMMFPVAWPQMLAALHTPAQQSRLWAQLWPSGTQARLLEPDASELEVSLDSLDSVGALDALDATELEVSLDDVDELTLEELEVSSEGLLLDVRLWLSVDELVVGSLTLLKDVDSVWLSVPDSLEDSEIDVV